MGVIALSLNKNHISMYLKSKNSELPLLYYELEYFTNGRPLENLAFSGEPSTTIGINICYGFELTLKFDTNNSSGPLELWSCLGLNTTALI